jgi:hypothetical protein
VIRNALFDMFQSFDVLDPSTVNAKRPTTVVPSQALFVMNSIFMREQSARFAQSLLEVPHLSEADRIRLAYRRAVQRSPRPEEIARVSGFVQQYESRLASTEQDITKRRLTAWQAFCQVLLASNEFIHVD